MSRPKSVVCYICGKQHLANSFQIHVDQCRELFEKRELQKPPKERKRCPDDPYAHLNKNYNIPDDQLNSLSSTAYSTALSQCENCGRRFLPDSLVIHLRSCKSTNPLKSIERNTNPSASNSRQQKSSDLNPNSLVSRNACRTGSSLTDTNKSTGSRNESIQSSSDSYSNNEYQSRSSAPKRSEIQPQNSMPINNRNKSSNSTSTMGYSNFTDSANVVDTGPLLPCKECGRTFNSISLKKHMKICRKVFKQTRKPFDSTKARTQGTELAQFQPSNRRGAAGSYKSKTTTSTLSTSGMGTGTGSGRGPIRSDPREVNGGMPKWKAQSLAFRAAIQDGEEAGMGLGLGLGPDMGPKGLGMGAVLLDTELVLGQRKGPLPGQWRLRLLLLPTLILRGRSFSEQAGERHVPQCKTIINKPSRLQAGGRSSQGLSSSIKAPEQQRQRSSSMNRAMAVASTSNSNSNSSTTGPSSSSTAQYSNGRRLSGTGGRDIPSAYTRR
eukprot:gene8722-18034_t